MKTIIFDLGKVIVPFEVELRISSLKEITTLTAEDVNEKILLSVEGRSYEEGKLSSAEFYEFVAKTLESKMSFEKFSEVWNSIFMLEPILDESLIEELSRKYKLLILSDTNEIHFEFIKQNFPILRHFDDFVLSYEVGYLKPSKEIFQAAVEKAGCLPEECFFTDDKLENVVGAKKYGINAVQFISAEQFEEYLADNYLIKKELR